MACEKCWDDAYLRAMLSNRGQSDCYAELLEERRDNPCTPEEQRGDHRRSVAQVGGAPGSYPEG